MPLTIDNAVLSSGLLKGLKQSADAQQSSLEKLAAGRKVNSAADNAAALQIINQFSTQIIGSAQAARNSSDGISFSQVAEGGLGSITENLQRIRELSLQAANGTVSNDQRAALQAEVSELQQEVTRTLDTTRFNNVDIFSANLNINFQVGPNSGDNIDLTLPDLATELSPLSSIDISTQAGADSALSSVDSALQSVASASSELGAAQSRFESAINNLENTEINTAEARSRLRDTDYARQSSELIQSSIQQQSGIAVQGQANASAQLVLQLLS